MEGYIWNQYTLSISCYPTVNHTHHESIHKRIHELRVMVPPPPPVPPHFSPISKVKQYVNDMCAVLPNGEEGETID